MTFLIEQWKKLAPRDRKALTICLAFMTVMGAYLGILEPLLNTYEEAVRKKTDLQQSIARDIPKVQVLPLRMAQLKRAQAEYDNLHNRLSLTGLNAWRLSEVYHEIRVYASTTGVSVKDIRPMARRKAGFLTGLPLEVTFQGVYKDIVKFIYYLETSPQVLVLTRLDLSGETTPLTGTIIVSKVEMPDAGPQVKINRAVDLVLTVAPWDGFAPFEYAKRQGWLQTNSTNVEFYFSQYESTSFDMIAANEIDGTAAPVLDMIKMLIEGIDVKVIAPLAFYTVTEALFVAPESDIEAVEDLRGKTVYLEKDGVEHFLLYKILKKHNMTLSDVRVEDMERMVVAQSLAAGLIEVGVTSDPFTAQLVEDREARMLVTPKDWQANILLLLLFREDALPGKGEAMNSLLKAYYSVAEKWRNDPELAVNFIGGNEPDPGSKTAIRNKMAHVRYLTPDEVKSIVCPRAADIEPGSFLNEYKDFLEKNLGYTVDVPMEDLVDWSYVREVFNCSESVPAKAASGS